MATNGGLRRILLSPSVGALLMSAGSILGLWGFRIAWHGLWKISPGQLLMATSAPVIFGGLCLAGGFILIRRGGATKTMARVVLYTIIAGAAVVGTLGVLAVLSEDWGDWQIPFLFAILAISVCVVSWLFWRVFLRREGKMHLILVPPAVFVLYNAAFGGGILVERTYGWSENDSHMGINFTTVNPMDRSTITLWGYPVTNRFYVPFLFYFINRTYPLRVSLTQWEFDDHVVFEEITCRCSDLARNKGEPILFKVPAGDKFPEFPIPEPGEWIVELKGYHRETDGEKTPFVLPPVNIRLDAEKVRTRVKGCFGFMWREFSLLI